ncbi:glycolipid transfer protein isoform X1 [Maniola jurtina]|uniref:glycolipid transfer protein isoform X1 n=1 Tax=Maniola jurtina TaxID=191418 RepID=UPI001E68C93A|nr:glycolipid transfer protein isoform X1 [Maniola jurtina]XP_045784824.1 glycolipid transfer protein isoform X1 [Maniola jurtina]XP_045784833.1 glycolipid transfer protein isoform X1 [Maniola jurtina]XP_045784842.1 glycolipid transfer protein isoform X1 [Maniola jurtina]
MASSSEENQNCFSFEAVKSFPSVANGKINIICFLEATSDLISLVGRLGKAFAPVKYDMQGNVDKIKMHYDYDKDSCLLELMLDEHSKGQHTAVEGVLWLNRALLFFELAFREIILCLQSRNYDENMKKIFTVAYEGSVKKYHNWFTQQLFALICKMSPTLPQIMKSFEIENSDAFEMRLISFNATLNPVRSKIDDFFKEHNMLRDSM